MNISNGPTTKIGSLKWVIFAITGLIEDINDIKIEDIKKLNNYININKIYIYI